MSLRFKLSAVTAALCLVTATSITALRTAVRLRELDTQIASKASVYAEVLGRQLESAVAYDDRVTAREVLESAASDRDVTQIALYGEGGQLIEGSAVPPPPWAEAPTSVATAHTASSVVAAAPIVSKEGPRAVLYIELGKERAQRAVRNSIALSAATSLGLTALAALLAWLVMGIVVRRLARIAATADRVAGGELALDPVEPGAPDEVGRLARAFNVMLERIRTEQERLAQLVDARTAELTTSREQYRQIAETTRAIPFEYEFDARRFTYVGPQCAALTGYSVSEWQQVAFLRSVMEPDEHDAMAADVMAQLERGPQYDHEFRMKSKDGRWVHLRSSANVQGRVARGLALDVTDKKALETELHQAQRLESVGRLAAGVAHEINTPVQYANDSLMFVRDAWADVVGLLDGYRAAGPVLDEKERAIDLDYLRDNVPRSAERALEGLSRIADIVRSMKAFSPSEPGEMTSCDVREGLKTTLTIARNEYKYAADVETVFDEVPPVLARPGDLNQVWLSLVTNAATAITDRGGERGRITVRTRAERDGVLVSVTDTGCGIPKDVQPRIFEQFFTTRAVGKGKGQSLAAARAIVRGHGGEIWFESKVGEGTTFYVALPAEGAAPVRKVA